MNKIIALTTMLLTLTVFAGERTIQVRGEWNTIVNDDRASILLTVETLDSNAKKASSTTDRIYNSLIKEVQRLKLKNFKMESTNYRLTKKYKWNKGTKKFLGHSATIGLRVKTSQIKRIGEVVQKAHKVGVKNIGDLKTYIAESTRKNVYLDGLAKASQDAKGKADRMLETLGAKRSHVLRIVEGASRFNPIPGPRPMFAMEKSSRSEPAPAAIQGGESSVAISVTITFEIK
ncbi:MAG: SIMPL domain-containing protein [Bacteriovoracaceae bacterium]|nr:SIMPL domain-containing protein [Bacteriovoracaceae bacterium]